MLILRQLALVTSDIKAAEEFFRHSLGLKVCYTDPGLKSFGLVNIILPIGDQFLEVVSPIKEGTTAGRFLEKNGDGGYIVITQCDDHLVYKRRVEELGVRIAHEFNVDGFSNMQLHPKDTGGLFLEIDQQLGPRGNQQDGPWTPAGHANLNRFGSEIGMAIKSVRIGTRLPAATAQKWSEIFGKKYGDKESEFEIVLENSSIFFAKNAGVSHERLISIGLSVPDEKDIIFRAGELGANCSSESFFAFGVDWLLSSN